MQNLTDIAAIGDFATSPIEGVEFKRLMAPDIALPFPPRFTFGSFPAQLAAMYYGLRGISSVGIFRLLGVELSGAFLLSRNGTYYRCPELNVHEAHIATERATLATGDEGRKRRHLSGSHVVLAGPGYGIYGHWLAEYLPKLSLLNFAGYDIHGLQYLLPATCPRFVRSLLELCTIKPEQIVIYDPTREIITADSLILPTILHNGLRMSPLFRDAALFLKGLIKLKHDLTSAGKPKRIFLSRAALGRQRMMENRSKIEELATRAKFTIVCPEQMPLVEQIQLFSGAREVMGEYGSALHGTIFSEPETVVCALRGPSQHPGFLQSGIGAAMDQPTGYIFGDTHGPEDEFGFRVSETVAATAMRLVFSANL